MKYSPVALCVALVLTWGQEAQAACEKDIAKLETTKGPAVAAAFAKVAACDAKVAEQVFTKAMVQAASSANEEDDDAEALSALAMAAIDNNVWKPVWDMPGKITDFTARDVVTRGIGEQCATNEKVVSFLQGAYFGLRDVEFARWEKAVVACQAESMDAWLLSVVEAPPPKQYDEKWIKLVDIYIYRKRVDALPALTNAGVKAAQIGGPYNAILAKMNEAVAPRMGEQADPAAQKLLEDAMVGMAKGLPPELARPIADSLANAGNDAAAASLLPVVYPNLKQADGFHYAAVSAEAGECKGVKTVVLHTAQVVDPGTHYIVLPAATPPMRSFKPALKKCTKEGDWVVVVGESPISGDEAVDALYNNQAKQWTDKGYTVKRKDEKPVSSK